LLFAFEIYERPEGIWPAKDRGDVANAAFGKCIEFGEGRIIVARGKVVVCLIVPKFFTI
jgi:hypothetical protein